MKKLIHIIIFFIFSLASFASDEQQFSFPACQEAFGDGNRIDCPMLVKQYDTQPIPENASLEDLINEAGKQGLLDQLKAFAINKLKNESIDPLKKEIDCFKKRGIYEMLTSLGTTDDGMSSEDAACLLINLEMTSTVVTDYPKFREAMLQKGILAQLDDPLFSNEADLSLAPLERDSQVSPPRGKLEYIDDLLSIEYADQFDKPLTENLGSAFRRITPEPTRDITTGERPAPTKFSRAEARDALISYYSKLAEREDQAYGPGGDLEAEGFVKSEMFLIRGAPHKKEEVLYTHVYDSGQGHWTSCAAFQDVVKNQGKENFGESYDFEDPEQSQAVLQSLSTNPEKMMGLDHCLVTPGTYIPADGVYPQKDFNQLNFDSPEEQARFNAASLNPQRFGESIRNAARESYQGYNQNLPVFDYLDLGDVRTIKPEEGQIEKEQFEAIQAALTTASEKRLKDLEQALADLESMEGGEIRNLFKYASIPGEFLASLDPIDILSCRLAEQLKVDQEDSDFYWMWGEMAAIAIAGGTCGYFSGGLLAGACAGAVEVGFAGARIFDFQTETKDLGEAGVITPDELQSGYTQQALDIGLIAAGPAIGAAVGVVARPVVSGAAQVVRPAAQAVRNAVGGVYDRAILPLMDANLRKSADEQIAIVLEMRKYGRSIDAGADQYRRQVLRLQNSILRKKGLGEFQNTALGNDLIDILKNSHIPRNEAFLEALAKMSPEARRSLASEWEKIAALKKSLGKDINSRYQALQFLDAQQFSEAMIREAGDGPITTDIIQNAMRERMSTLSEGFLRDMGFGPEDIQRFSANELSEQDWARLTRSLGQLDNQLENQEAARALLSAAPADQQQAILGLQQRVVDRINSVANEIAERSFATAEPETRDALLGIKRGLLEAEGRSGADAVTRGVSQENEALLASFDASDLFGSGNMGVNLKQVIQTNSFMDEQLYRELNPGLRGQNPFDMWWLRQEITNTRSIARKIYGDEVIREVFWMRGSDGIGTNTFGVRSALDGKGIPVDMENTRYAVNYLPGPNGTRIPQSLEVMALKEDGSYEPFVFMWEKGPSGKPDDGRWVMSDTFVDAQGRVKPTKDACASCHRASDGRISVMPRFGIESHGPGVFKPTPFRQDPVGSLVESGYDRDLAQRMVNAVTENGMAP